MESLPFLKACRDGVVIQVHVQPRASRNRLAGIHGNRLKLAVQAPPSGGKANKACQELLAKAFGIPKSGVVLKSGGSSRQKSFVLHGLTLEECAALLPPMH